MAPPRPDAVVNFAYGSNMCSHRLRERVPSARPMGIGRLLGHRLAWHMAGSDGSGKCDIVETGRVADVVWGVLYEIAAHEWPRLDEAEGLGRAYRRKRVTIEGPDGRIEAEAYAAMRTDATRVPFDWYHGYVLAGAIEHGLPTEYAEALKSLATMVDDDEVRRRRNQRTAGGAA